MKQYLTYFVDDTVRFLENLSKNRPASIFDDPYLKAHKELHDKYGLKVQFNLFYETLDKSWNLAKMTDAYKEEFLANKDWIKFGFHSKHELPDYPYINATYDQVWKDYTAIEKAIERFAGKEMITKPPPIVKALMMNVDLNNFQYKSLSTTFLSIKDLIHKYKTIIAPILINIKIKAARKIFISCSFYIIPSIILSTIIFSSANNIQLR